MVRPIGADSIIELKKTIDVARTKHYGLTYTNSSGETRFYCVDKIGLIDPKRPEKVIGVKREPLHQLFKDILDQLKACSPDDVKAKSEAKAALTTIEEIASEFYKKNHRLIEYIKRLIQSLFDPSVKVKQATLEEKYRELEQQIRILRQSS